MHHLGQNHVALMAGLGRTLLQLLHDDVAAQQVWAPAKGSSLKCSLMPTILGMMKRGYILMLFRIYDGHLGLKTKMRQTMTKWVRTMTLHLLNGTVRTLRLKKVPFLHP
jgi:hypothetical protein